MQSSVCQSIDTRLIFQYKPFMHTFSLKITMGKRAHWQLPVYILILAVLAPLLACASPYGGPAATVAIPTLEPPPTQTPTPTVTPNPTPPPPPPPAALVEGANAAFEAGDYDQALIDYQTVLNGSPTPELQAASLYGIGRILFAQENPAAALESFRRLVEGLPGSIYEAQAYYFIGRIFAQLQSYPESAAAFQRYLELRPGVLDQFILEKRGDSLLNAGDYSGAISSYEAAINAPHIGTTDNLGMKIAQAAAASGDYRGAILKYQDLYSQSTSDYTRARLLFLEGQAYQVLGETENATNRFVDTVNSFPRAYEAYSALVDLVNAGVVVNEFNRGLVDYFAGQYDLAVTAFDRYIASGAKHDGTPLYYKGLALREISTAKSAAGSAERMLGDGSGVTKEDGLALATWDAFLKDYPDNRYWTDALDEKAYTQWLYLGQPQEAARTMLNFVANSPTHARAAEFLFYAGRYYERGGMLDEASATWARLGIEYPKSDYTFRGMLFAGVSKFRQAKFGEAQALFQKTLDLSSTTGDQAAAAVWIGKTLSVQSDPNGARQAWEQAVQYDPGGYYSERARDLLAGQPAFTPPASYDLAVDLPKEKIEADAWMRATFQLAPELDLSSPGDLAGDPRYIRGQEFWALGEKDRAWNEFEDLRLEVQKDVVKTYRLAGSLADLGLYRQATLASRQVLDSAGLDSVGLSAPIYFNHLRFGVYFKDLVISTAKDEGLDPLFLFSVIRQESLFETIAESGPGARGLMQLMPATAEGIVNQLGWPQNYSQNDLDRPLINIRLGAHYLAQQLAAFDHDPYAALAAYNGGPGNAQAWNDLAHGDPDLLLEIIRLQETRDYVTRIAEIYAIYKRIYTHNFS